MAIRIVPASGLEKIFLDRGPAGTYSGGSLLTNEQYSFQFAFTGIPGLSPAWTFAQIGVESDISDNLELFLVDNVPVTLPTYPRYDEGYLRTEPGLYPDPLFPLKDRKVKVLTGKWHAVWVRTKGEIPPGIHKVVMTLSAEGQEPASAEITLRVIAARLPEQKLLYTNWFHCDCIASLHHCPVFSERHWELIDAYMKLAGENGMNMILTPAFTPPLDTPVGEERDTVQLVDVEKKGDHYSFDFDKLDRYIALAKKNGINWFEHSHFFTQWGAKAAPKVVAEENGQLHRIFGWETQADGPEYTQFLHQYLDALIPHLKSLGVDRNFYYHISDEPVEQHLDSYRRAKAVVADRLKEYHLFDALSHVEFYEQGLVMTPVAVTSTVSDFIGKAEDLWTYYTGFQSFAYANRLTAMASRRNRVLGMQLYKYHIRGFLQWAFNFYYTTLCREVCDPFRSPDALEEFPAGTAYQVYPHPDGPIPSLRLFVFQDGVQDLRAMELLETAIGHDAVVELLEKAGGTIDWTSCPLGDEAFITVREALNAAIEQHFA